MCTGNQFLIANFIRFPLAHNTVHNLIAFHTALFCQCIDQHLVGDADSEIAGNELIKDKSFLHIQTVPGAFNKSFLAFIIPAIEIRKRIDPLV
ncbi:hypothetical protein D3C85_1193620 [compost metagenome]